MSRSRTKAPVLTLAPEQEREALDTLKRFLEDRFELQLGSSKWPRFSSCSARKLHPITTTGRLPMFSCTSRSGSRASKATYGRWKKAESRKLKPDRLSNNHRALLAACGLPLAA